MHSWSDICCISINFALETLSTNHLYTSSLYHINLYQDGEPVEFEVITEPNGRSKAFNVTGPDGSYVQGAPKRFRNDFGHDDGGF